MRQTWKYFEDDYVVDTEDMETYRDLVRELLDFNDCYEELVEYLDDNVGNSADLLIKMIWEGADYVVDRMISGFVGWMLNENRDRTKELVELNCTLMKEEEE